MNAIFPTLILAAGLTLAACGSKNDDRLSDDQVAAAAGAEPAAERPDRRCSAAASHEAVKRELFRRASEVRGSNQASYARIADFAVLSVDDAAPTAPAAAGEAVECSGRATLRLPPNLAVAGGRNVISGRIGFSVGAGAPPVVTMTDDEAITLPLATLSQKRVAPATPPARLPDPIAPLPAPVAPRPEPQAAPSPRPETAVARPSFDCRSARTRSELAVCASPALAGLDRSMATQFGVALSRADGPQRRLLSETRDRFLGYRDRCPDEACIATVYRGRMREIDDIMANRWQGRL